MVELRCNRCVHLKGEYCIKLREALPNGFAKLFYGGTSGDYGVKVTYSCKCGVDKQKKDQQPCDSELQVFVPTLAVIPA